MVAIDPPTSYLGEVDEHKNAELRGLLTPIKRWCAAQRNGVIFNNHVNKNVGSHIDAAMRVMGSVAWVNAVRAAHMFLTDQENKDEVLFLPLKLNVVRKPMGLAYKIVEMPSGEGKVQWTREVDQTADEAIQQIRKKPRVVAAAEFLKDLFTRSKQWTGDDFWMQAKQSGVSNHAINDFRRAEGWPFWERTSTPEGVAVYIWKVRPDWNGTTVTR